ncbi:MAG: protoporphyrinogen oxidase [Ardenticatenaceae bacterium]|nr:protoporphyrinogen oxidase [Ardenticatenaceae bacterium]
MTLHHITIIGGGISGLSTAYYVQQEAQKRGLDLAYTLLEQADRWGGKIWTETIEGYGDEPFVVERGPDAVLTQKPWALQLARELGIGEEFLPTNDDRRKTFVLNKGKPTPLPDGVMLIVPTQIKPFALSSLISPWGKLRMGLEWFIPAKTDDEDETLAQFITRRLGAEALDKIAEPLMSGIYNAEANMQSVLATFPRFRDIEKQHGSLIKGMLAAKKARPASSNGQSNGRSPAMFTSFKNGMEALVTALCAQLTGDCRLETAVQAITPGAARNYQVHLADGPSLDTDAVVLAVPAFAAAELLADIAPDSAQELRQIRYVSTGTVSLAFRREDVAHPLNGFGIVIPSSEKRRINAITWSSTKFNHRAPAGHVLLRVFFGGSRTPQMMALDDEELLKTVRTELADIMGLTTEPLFHLIHRWFDANAQYDVGHLERIAAVEAALPDGMYVTGSPYRGVGVPDCVKQGLETAVRVVANR